MSSSLISVGSVGASVATPGQSAAGESAPKTLMDVFAGLLAKASGDAETGVEITQSSSATINGVEVTEVAGDIIATLLQGQADAAPEGEDGAPTSLADLLLRLQAALDAGEALDPELLKKLSESIDALAAMIGGIEVSADGTVTADLSTDTAAKVAAPTLDTQPQDESLKGLADKLKELAGKLGDADGDLAAKLSALAEKLGAVKTTAAELLEDAPELKAVIDALVQPKAEAKTTLPPAFAAPELRLPENPSLSAKKTEAPAPPVAPVPEGDAAPEADLADTPKPQIKADVKPEPGAAPPIEKREAAPAAPAHTPPTMPDTSVAATTASVNSIHGAEHGSHRAAHSAYATPSPVNLPQMAFEIVRQVQQGVSKFQIRLDPPEMGRIDVKLDIDAAGQVNARLTVERAETLDLLQRDQRALERALAQAGLDTNKTNLEFSLKQNPFAGQDGKGQRPDGLPFGGDGRGSVIAEAEPTVTSTIYRGSASASGVNIFV